MTKRVKFRRLIPGPLARRYRRAKPKQRDALETVITREKEARCNKMEARGYKLEAIVSKFYGVFTRGSAVGSIELVDRDRKSLPKAS